MKLILVLGLFVLSFSWRCPMNCYCTGCGCSQGCQENAQNCNRCKSCLPDYNRRWDSNEKDCTCIDTFVEMTPQLHKCRPVNCSTYSDEGNCLTCSEVMKLQTFSNITVCVCQDNYYNNGNNTCECLSVTNPQQYYSTVNSQCKKCPTGCSCDMKGCYQCSSESKRTVTKEGSLLVCGCVRPYIQIGGVCTLYAGCSVQFNNGAQVLICKNSSLREEISPGVWKCIAPYQDVNGGCQCIYPWLMDQFILDSPAIFCACASKKEPNRYYEYNNICYICPLGCTCNELGCIYCPVGRNRTINGITCFCSANFVEYDGRCICIQPYYLHNNGSCVCLSLISHDFYRDPSDDNKCYPCPIECNCSIEQGCYSCSPSLRLVVLGPDDYSTCNQCHTSAIQANGNCFCPPLAVPHGNTCQCSNSTAIYRDWSYPLKCYPCPESCECSEIGCYNCLSNTNRNLSMNDGTCHCNWGFSEVAGKCGKCIPPLVLTQSGECIYDYKYRDGHCMSLHFPDQFWNNTMTDECLACPDGCNCTWQGCISCQPTALRVILSYKGLFLCPCSQSAFLINGVCTYCSNNSLSIDGLCIHCDGCATCGAIGCIKCHDDASPQYIIHSNKTLCVCLNLAFINNNGTCECPVGGYLKQVFKGNITCLTCPDNCRTCISNQTTGFVVCTSCLPNSNRMNSVRNDCVCQTGFRQSSPIQPFCCSFKCQTCNATGCLTCRNISNRQLKGQECVCRDTFVESGNEVCKCPNRTVARSGVCLTCPAYCNECLYKSQAIYCASCRDGVNRNKSDTTKCSCLDGFTQAPLEMPFCIPLHCLEYNDKGVCAVCTSSRSLSPDGSVCLCPNQTFDTHSNGTCMLCSSVMEGCITCSNNANCTNCRTQQGYVLIGTTNGTRCRMPTNSSSAVVVQSSQGIRLQIKLKPQEIRYTVIRELVATLYTVYDTPPLYNASANSSFLLGINSSNLLVQDTLQVIINNPIIHLKNQLIDLQYTLLNYTSRNLGSFSGSDSTGNYTGLNSNAYVPLLLVCSTSQVSIAEDSDYIVSTIIVALFLIVALLLYILGFKHNQMPFFLQTMGLLNYTIQDSDFTIPRFLYIMRITWYEYGHQASKNFIPDDYIESSIGNFAYLESDSNIIRVAFTTLSIAAVNSLLIVVLRIIFRFRKVQRIRRFECIRNVSDSSKKSIYRFLEFFYKTCMYPLLFFSIVNLRNWNATILTPSPTFRGFSLSLSVVIPVAYTAVTAWQWFLETTAKINRIENVLEFSTSLIGAVILSLTIHSDFYMALVPVFCIRAIGYLWARKVLLRDFNNVEFMKIATTVFEITTLCVIKTLDIRIITALMCLTVGTQVTHQIASLVLTSKKANPEKGHVTEECSAPSSLVVDSHYEVDKDLSG